MIQDDSEAPMPKAHRWPFLLGWCAGAGFLLFALFLAQPPLNRVPAATAQTQPAVPSVAVPVERIAALDPRRPAVFVITSRSTRSAANDAAQERRRRPSVLIDSPVP